MPSDVPNDAVAAESGGVASETKLDVGLLSPVTVGYDGLVADGVVLDALVTAEVALMRVWGAHRGQAEAAEEASRVFGWRGDGQLCAGHGIDPAGIAAAAVGGGNPVIPLVAGMKDLLPRFASEVHRGATSQDILDSALMLVSRRAGERIGDSLGRLDDVLTAFADDHRDDVAAARTLTQHAVPTTVGLRAVGWLRAVRRARGRLAQAVGALPAQLGGAAGTLASFVELAGEEDAARLPAAFAAELGLAPPEAPWHTTRWPITELGDALVQVIDAVGLIAADVATLSRTEIGEVFEGEGGGSSAMPQKQNPAASVLIRSAALRAPQLGATLHLAAALAVDERPDGAWHAEWPTLRELLRLGLGAVGTAERLVAGLRIDGDAVSRNLALTHGLIVAERLSLALSPLIGRDRVAAIVAEAQAGGDLPALVRRELRDASAGEDALGLPVDDLLDPARYTGLAGRLVDDAVARRPTTDQAEASS